jgi:kynurenine formamidase
MNTRMAGALVVMTVAATTLGGPFSQARSQDTASAPRVTRADIERWKTEHSNWGRWGKDDQLGALNLITPAKRKQAAGLVREGFSVSLAHDAEMEKGIDNANPYQRTMTSISVDRLAVSFHGYIHTHLDSLAHSSDDGKLYNGHTPQEAVVMKEGGHARNSVYNLKNGVFTRGILMDIPRLKGVEYLEPGTHIYPADLEAWEKKAGVKVSAGDALFVRTGRWVRRAKVGPWDVARSAAGLDVSCIPWLKQRDVALLAGESPQDVVPQGEGLSLSAKNPGSQLVVHGFALVYLGAQLIDNADLDALAEAAAARKRWEFLFTVAPLPLRGGTGSPANPIATF